MNAPHRDDRFFTEDLAARDPELFSAIESELGRETTFTVYLPHHADC